MIRIGIDFGGTKIEAAALSPEGEIVARRRIPNPGAYDKAVHELTQLILSVEQEAGGGPASVGIGAPGSVSPVDGRMRNANSVWLNGMPFREDMEAALQRPVRLANDANCLVLSEASDGAAAGAHVVFGAILGTGCGGGLVVDGRLIEGASGIAGEWGHTPLPWPTADEYPGQACWCGRQGCLETWISGTGFEADYARAAGRKLAGPAIVQAARDGEPDARAALDRYVDRLGRGFGVICDLVDPNVIVLGGGMSNVAEVYPRLSEAVAKSVFSDHLETRIVQAKHGDSSGVRGAAWLWPLEPA